MLKYSFSKLNNFEFNLVQEKYIIFKKKNILSLMGFQKLILNWITTVLKGKF